MKTAPSMNTVDFFTFCELHQLWQAVILKPLKLEGCILHFWKSPIFIIVIPTGQGHSCILNTYLKIHPKDGWFHSSLFTKGLYPFFNDCSLLCHHMIWHTRKKRPRRIADIFALPVIIPYSHRVNPATTAAASQAIKYKRMFAQNLLVVTHILWPTSI